MMQQRKQNIFMKVWGIPIALFALTLAGLIICLVKDGFWDTLAWLSLIIPILLIVRYYYWQKDNK